MSQKVFYTHLGITDYKQTWDLQEKLLQEIVAVKMEGHQSGNSDKSLTAHYLLLCEHPHVFTLGKSGKQEHLLVDQKQLNENQATFYKINRGGDITYHGPGQIVGYPILNLDHFYNDIHLYLRNLEEVIILTIAHFGIKGERIDKLTGVWIDAGTAQARKICAFGVRCSRWVTMHGWALNVNTNLDYFSHIVPCGIDDKAVTSMQKELGREVNMAEVEKLIKENFELIFNVLLVDKELKLAPALSS